MSDLAKTYFQRELSPHEEEGLARQLGASMELAERFAALAAADYARLKLPEPQWPESRKRRWLLVFLALGLGGLWAWLGRNPVQEAAPEPRSLAMPGDSFEVEPSKPHSAPARESVAEEGPLEQASHGSLALRAVAISGGFHVSLSQPNSSPGPLSVLDAKGQVLRVLDDSGKGWDWDSRDNLGRMVPSGRYQFRIKIRGAQLRQWVEVGRAK